MVLLSKGVYIKVKLFVKNIIEMMKIEMWLFIVNVGKIKFSVIKIIVVIIVCFEFRYLLILLFSVLMMIVII